MYQKSTWVSFVQLPLTFWSCMKSFGTRMLGYHCKGKWLLLSAVKSTET